MVLIDIGVSRGKEVFAQITFIVKQLVYFIKRAPLRCARAFGREEGVFSLLTQHLFLSAALRASETCWAKLCRAYGAGEFKSAALWLFQPEATSIRALLGAHEKFIRWVWIPRFARDFRKKLWFGIAESCDTRIDNKRMLAVWIPRSARDFRKKLRFGIAEKASLGSKPKARK